MEQPQDPREISLQQLIGSLQTSVAMAMVPPFLQPMVQKHGLEKGMKTARLLQSNMYSQLHHSPAIEVGSGFVHGQRFDTIVKSEKSCDHGALFITWAMAITVARDLRITLADQGWTTEQIELYFEAIQRLARQMVLDTDFPKTLQKIHK